MHKNGTSQVKMELMPTQLQSLLLVNKTDRSKVTRLDVQSIYSVVLAEETNHQISAYKAQLQANGAQTAS